MKDWRGNEFDVGSTVLYARMDGRCVEVVEAEVLDIWYAFLNDDFKWERLPSGKRATKMKSHYDHSTREVIVTDEPDDELRIKLQPNGKGSRFRSYQKEFKPVTLTITDNITAL